MKEKQYKICTKCIMDSSDENISFDKNGKCNHCYSYEYSNNISNSEIYAYKSILNKIKNN